MARGIDLSNNNGTIGLPDGIAFLFCKATEGVSFTDHTQPHFVELAKQAGIPHGPYHFAHPDQNAPEDEAAFFLAHAIPGDFWSLDCETRQGVNPLAVMGASRLAAWCDVFYAHVAPVLGAGGYHYTFRSYADALWPKLVQPWRWWLASAAGSPSFRTYAGRTVHIEQYAIVGGVDQNESYAPVTQPLPAPPQVDPKKVEEAMLQPILRADGTIQVFVVGEDGAVWTIAEKAPGQWPNKQDGTKDWQSLGGAVRKS